MKPNELIPEFQYIHIFHLQTHILKIKIIYNTRLAAILFGTKKIRYFYKYSCNLFKSLMEMLKTLADDSPLPDPK